MKKFIFALSATTLIASCSFQQKPAPYEANSSEYYGRGNSRAYVSNDIIAPNKKRSDSRFAVESTSNVDNNEFSYSGNSAGDDYNSKIDSYNASNTNKITSRPLVTAKTSAQQEVYPHQQASVTNAPPLGSINSRPLAPMAIDGNEQIVKIGEKQPVAPAAKPQIQPKITTAYDLQRQNYSQNNQRSLPEFHEGEGATANEEETIPPVNSKPGYINLTQINEGRKVDDKLSRIKPQDKPRFVEEVEVAKKAAPVAEKEIAEEPKAVEEPEVVEKEEEETIAPVAAAPVVEKAPAVTEKAAAPVVEEKPVETVAAPEKPKKITPVIQRVETTNEPASGAIQKSTISMMNKPQAEEEDDSETLALPAAKPAVKPVAEAKPVAAEAPKSSSAFIKPVDGVVVSEFGSSKTGGGVNDGINIQAPEGTPVKAAKGGTVVYSGNQLQGYGNLIIVRHPDGYLTAYSHLKELELKKGEPVKQGDVLGHVGKTGNVETPQLHFGIRKGREPVDPKDYL